MFLCEQHGEEERWKQIDTYTASTRYWLQDVTYHTLDTYQNWQCLMESQISRRVLLKIYPRCPIKYRTLNSSSNIAKLKHNLMNKFTKFSASRLIHRFKMSARCGSTRSHNTLSNEISSNCPLEYIDGLIHSIHSVFAESLNWS